MVNMVTMVVVEKPVPSHMLKTLYGLYVLRVVDFVIWGSLKKGF